MSRIVTGACACIGWLVAQTAVTITALHIRIMALAPIVSPELGATILSAACDSGGCTRRRVGGEARGITGVCLSVRRMGWGCNENEAVGDAETYMGHAPDAAERDELARRQVSSLLRHS